MKRSCGCGPSCCWRAAWSRPRPRRRPRRRRRRKEGEEGRVDPPGAAARRGRGAVQAADPARRRRSIDGTGAPPIGPVDIVIERNRIADVRSVGCPEVPIRAEQRPKAEAGDQRDRPRTACTCCRASSTCTATSAARSRGRRPSTSSSSGWRTASPPSASRAAATASTGRSTSERERSARNEITAPRIKSVRLLRRMGRDEPINTPGAGARGRRRSPPRAPTASSSSATGRTSCRRPLDESTKQGAALAPATTRRWTWRGSTSLDLRALGPAPRWSTGTASPRRCSTTAPSRTIRPTTTTTTSRTASARPGGSGSRPRRRARSSGTR